MKSKFKKILASCVAALMLVTAFPLSAMAATTLTFAESTIGGGEYSFILHNGDSGDYIASVLQGVDTDKQITVAEGTSSVSVVLNSGSYSSATGYADVTAAAWHYGTSSSYCIGTDYAFTLTGIDISATVSGFGASSVSNGSYTPTSSSTDIATTFTIDTSSLSAGTYDLSLYFKYQMKKKELTSWSTKYEYSDTLALTLVVQPKITYTYVDGSSTTVTDGSTPANTASKITSNDNGTHTTTTYTWVADGTNAYKEQANEVTADCSYDEGTTVQEATSCKETSTIIYNCTVCGYQKTEDGAAGAHVLSHYAVKDATCTENGNTEYWQCTTCGKYFSDSEAENETTIEAVTIAASSSYHKYAATVTAPTCTEGGYTTYTCSVCGDSYTADKTAATGHSMSYTAGKAATCTESGTVENYYCSSCGKYFKDEDGNTEIASITISATGHVLEKVEAKDPTCIAAGNTEYYYCSGCGKYFEDSLAENETTLEAVTIAASSSYHNYVATV
ncbi:MAG: hypothetical protein LUH82_04235, partial [Clostridiales bacterium]|nr:hypothetical protein [Clostridiales bacterium]